MTAVTVHRLVVDESIYPRHKRSSTHVGELVEAMKAGAVLPAIIVETGTLRIVDGVHRTTAYRRHFGDDHLVEIEERTYDTEEDLLLDACLLNAGHGLRLNDADHKRCMTIGNQLGVDPERLANALNLTVQRITDLKLRHEAISGKTLRPVNVPISARHLAGKMLTRRQEAGMGQLASVPLQRHVKQLRTALAHDLVDRENASLMDELKGLYGDLRAIVDPQGDTLYIVRRPSDGAFKVGFTDDLSRRMREHRRAHGQELELVGYFAGSQAEEAALHELFAPARINGEWYSLEDDRS